MYRFFAVALLEYIPTMQERHPMSVWICTRRWRESHSLNSVLFRDMLVPFKLGLKRGSRQLEMWKGLAERSCRAWNALHLAAELAVLDVRTGPGILADRMEEMGESRLEALLRANFEEACGTQKIPASVRVVPPMPEGHADAPIGISHWLESS